MTTEPPKMRKLSSNTSFFKSPTFEAVLCFIRSQYFLQNSWHPMSPVYMSNFYYALWLSTSKSNVWGINGRSGNSSIMSWFQLTEHDRAGAVVCRSQKRQFWRENCQKKKGIVRDSSTLFIFFSLLHVKQSFQVSVYPHFTLNIKPQVYSW